MTKLTKAQIRDGKNGAELDGLTPAQREAVLKNTPLWFYVLREAELNGGRLKGVGARDRRRDLPPRDGGQHALDRARPRVAPDARPQQHDLPHGRPAAVRLRGQEGAAGAAGLAGGEDEQVAEPRVRAGAGDRRPPAGVDGAVRLGSGSTMPIRTSATIRPPTGPSRSPPARSSASLRM